MSTRSPPKADDWQRIKQLFDLGVAMEVGARATFLAAADVSDAVREEVRSLLLHADIEGDNAISHAVALEALLPPAHIGERFGAWTLLRLLGAGGMGEVFEARRSDGSYEGRAAVKILKRGMDSALVLQRFAQERQALAWLNHPNIARLLDAGLGPDGLPYVVMEYVDGRHIDLAVAGMDLAQRLGVFLQLTDAVTHAHRHLLVHRDLKPGNVLVTADSQVKLLDFGIAKALAPADGSDRTGVGATPPFTPHYASPEQVNGGPVTTATDVYSLGVLLYQLLTGVRPTGRHAGTAAEAARSVIDETPQRPSGLEGGEVTDANWSRIRKRLAGDLDNIVLKALEKDPARRYHSVDALSQDLRNWLGGHRVSARAPTWTYLASKFVGRHPLGTALSAIGVLALLGATASALWQANLAERERLAAQRHLEDVRGLARAMIFDVNDALSNGITPGRAALVAAGGKYLTRRMNAPDLSAEETFDIVAALQRMGDIEGNIAIDSLGKSDSALQRYDQALQLLERVPVARRDAPQWWSVSAGVLRRQAMLLQSKGDPARAYAAANAGIGKARHALEMGAADPNLRRLACKLRANLTDTLYSMDELPNLGRLGDALASAGEAVRCAEQLPGTTAAALDNGLVLSMTLARQARLAMMAGQFTLGVDSARRNVALIASLRVHAPGNQELNRFDSIALSLLGYNLVHAGQTAAGLAALTEGVDLARKQLRADTGSDRARRDFVALAWTLGENMVTAGQASDALRYCEESKKALVAFPMAATTDAYLLNVNNGLARCMTAGLLGTGQAREALSTITASLADIGARALRHPTDQGSLASDLGLGELLRARVLQRLGNDAEAFAAASASVRQMEQHLRLDADNAETINDTAYVHVQASLVGHGRGQLRARCAWAGLADAAFESLARQSRLNLEYRTDAATARQQVRRCGASAG